MQQFKQEKDNTSRSMFAEGGKLHYLLCKHARGGHIADCGCKEDGGEINKAEKGYKVKNGSYEASVNAPGDTTRTKQYKYRTEVMQTYPDGTVRYSTTDNHDGFTSNR